MIDVIELRRKFHQIPEVGFQEFETSRQIKEILNEHEIGRASCRERV